MSDLSILVPAKSKRVRSPKSAVGAIKSNESNILKHENSMKNEFLGQMPQNGIENAFLLRS